MNTPKASSQITALRMEDRPAKRGRAVVRFFLQASTRNPPSGAPMMARSMMEDALRPARPAAIPCVRTK